MTIVLKSSSYFLFSSLVQITLFYDFLFDHRISMPFSSSEYFLFYRQEKTFVTVMWQKKKRSIDRSEERRIPREIRRSQHQSKISTREPLIIFIVLNARFVNDWKNTTSIIETIQVLSIHCPRPSTYLDVRLARNTSRLINIFFFYIGIRHNTPRSSINTL